MPATFPIVFDAAGATPAAFDVKGMPSSYLVDRRGMVVAVEEGFHDERHGDARGADPCAAGRALTRAIAAMVAACAVAVAGCASFDPPKPWEKGDLARPSMHFDADPLASKTTQHIYQSKEGAAGGGSCRWRRMWLQLNARGPISIRRPR